MPCYRGWAVANVGRTCSPTPLFVLTMYRGSKICLYYTVAYQRLLLSLSLSSVVTRHVMMKMFVFSFQWNIQQIICEIEIATNAISRASHTFCVFEHFLLCVCPLPVSLWRFVEFVKDSLVDTCWERADPLCCFTLCCLDCLSFFPVWCLGKNVEFDCYGSWSLPFQLLWT